MIKGMIGAERRIGSETSYQIRCAACGDDVPLRAYRTNCPGCAGSLEFTYPPASANWIGKSRSIWRYRSRLPVGPEMPVVSMGEGGTPQLRVESESRFELFLKNETLNPTGSHKDRALSIGITKAREFDFDTCMLYSDGSAALASAAYAARAGMRNIVLVPRGASDSRILPLLVYNSAVLEFLGDSDDALDWVHEACECLGIYETSTYRKANPYESEGPKTISYEIFEDLGDAPDWVVVPVGGGGTLAGIWHGFRDLVERGLARKLPRMAGVLPGGYPLLELGLTRGVDSAEDLRMLADFQVPETAQIKIAMRRPPDGVEAIAAIRQSGGRFLFASDAEAWQAQRRLGAQEGIYAEVSAAVALVGVEKLQTSGAIAPGEQVVAIVCGSGFRETAALASQLPLTKIEIGRDGGFERLRHLLEDGI